MKNIRLFILTATAVSLSATSRAQTIFLSDFGKIASDEKTNFIEQVCYDTTGLAAISDSMFREGNPKYIWVDLFRDGYLEEGNDLVNLYFSRTGSSDAESAMSQREVTRYALKWDTFLQHIGEPASKHPYHFTCFSGINRNNILNPESELRKYNKRDLRHLGLTATGELRLYNELIKDGLTTAEQPMNLEFNMKGFFVHDKQLPRHLREKYSALCKEEFGSDYYGDKSSMKIGALPENPLSKQIAELTARINGTYQPEDQQ